MRRGARRATRRRCGAGALACAAALIATPAAADPKRECSDAYYQTQVLRDDGKLEQALAAAQRCAKDDCASFVRGDCAGWQVDLEARLARLAATLRVEVNDKAGAPLRAGSVWLDGARWLDRLDGPAQPLKQGAHTLEVRVDGAPPQTRSITVREGEKDQRVVFTVDVPRAPDDPGLGPGPWILGGAGVAALLGGAVVGGFVVDAYTTTQAECDDARRVCTAEGLDAQEQGRALGPWTTGLLIGGGALVAGAVIWIVVDRTAQPRAAVALLPAVGPGTFGVRIARSW